ncbi:MAG TPA: LamG-like jellyroll fold domain-containing protein [Bryobacteraceae bacterium]|nr:LamG-like jellyroll fold domain-containing protein [Bryobacteraceae bacterium]
MNSLILAPAPVADEVWRFDRLDQVGGHKTTVLGHPQIIETRSGKAVQFNGVDDALFLDVHPLAGAQAFTWEVIFRPDSGGAAEQRFFHLQEAGSDNRMLFEIRVTGNQWCLDSFAKSGDASKALLDRSKLHPLDRWYAVEAVYDGHEFRNYVDGVPQGSAELHLNPQGQGQTSVGVRINKRDYFKGAVRLARFTRRALAPSDFLRPGS